MSEYTRRLRADGELEIGVPLIVWVRSDGGEAVLDDGISLSIAVNGLQVTDKDLTLDWISGV